jgi:organic hydroperoxide reductase OsmC/OhrA
MSEKQTTFFIINCAENLESPNQCEQEQVTASSHTYKKKLGDAMQLHTHHTCSSSDNERTKNLIVRLHGLCPSLIC